MRMNVLIRMHTEQMCNHLNVITSMVVVVVVVKPYKAC